MADDTQSPQERYEDILATHQRLKDLCIKSGITLSDKRAARLKEGLDRLRKVFDEVFGKQED